MDKLEHIPPRPVRTSPAHHLFGRADHRVAAGLRGSHPKAIKRFLNRRYPPPVVGHDARASQQSLAAQKHNGPRIVCNMYYWVQLSRLPFDTSFQTRPAEGASASPAAHDRRNDLDRGAVAYSPLRCAIRRLNRRMEMRSGTIKGKPMEDILELLKQYGLIVNHLWHAGGL
jgi:hypothetical protein